MSNPLYFVTNCKESISVSWASPLPIGCGVTKNGELRQNQSFWKSSPLIFDDAITAMPTEICLKSLRMLCEKGCILDFERPMSAFHRLIIGKMEEWKVSPLWLPERFAHLSARGIVMINSGFPHNSWRQFCTVQQRKYPNHWALEFEPLLWEKKLLGTAKENNIYLSEAICMCKIKAGTALYYDTLQTLQKRMQIAEELGCQGGIALWQEWQK